MQGKLTNDIKYLPGVGERRASLLASEIGIRTFGDLLYYFPFRHVDRTRIYRITEVSEEHTSYIQIRARVMNITTQGAGAKQRLIVRVADSSGAAELVWFKGIKWIGKKIEAGREYIIFGKPNIFKGALSFVHPEVELVEHFLSRQNASVQGVYSTTERLTTSGLGSKGIYGLVCSLWPLVEEEIVDTLPRYIVEGCQLVDLRTALHDIHFPPSNDALSKAERRLKFEELFGIQLGILSRRATRTTNSNGFIFNRVGDHFRSLYASLPFPLTDAQQRVIKEIRADTVTGHQMNRLLQGDVGSGKTLVALASMMLAVDNGFQTCMMAPTEILARQHFASIERFVENTPAKGCVAVLTGATRAKERREILAGLADGRIKILVGTHALIEDAVQFANLGFVVIDEQHRFGVEQRAKMWTKNQIAPHILVMTATPIPRTLAMTLYGDLDISVIDKLPPGRKPIKTRHLFESQRLMLHGFIKREIAAGRQVYVVYPLIKESEKADYKNLYEGFAQLTDEFREPTYRVGAVHGKMTNEEKNGNMDDFKRGITNILVATSVIEVGVDVPNATVMVIESAERFGLSQLHQLRGRVGRGGEQSYCVLMSGDKLTREAKARLGAMVETTDGFRLAELDLKLRGAGDMAGTQQSGEPFELRIASVSRDNQIVEWARRVAEKVLAEDPTLSLPKNRGLEELRKQYSGKEQKDFAMIS